MVINGITGGRMSNMAKLVVLIVYCLIYLLLLVPSLAIGVRRFHDVGISGYVYLVLLITVPLFLGLIAIFIISLLDGNPYQNEYGPDPKGRGTSYWSKFEVTKKF